LAAREPGTEFPPRGLLGPAHARGPAYIYSEADIAALIQAALTLTPANGLRPRTYATLIGLLASTGLRIAESLALVGGDLDWSTGVLTVRRTKFSKSRLVPLHSSAVGQLKDYAEIRDRFHPSRPDTPFFVSEAGRSLCYGTVRHTFHVLLRQALPGAAPVGRVRPRLHDLRHTFACRRLLAWYRDGTDIDRSIDQLSAYLGHAKVSDTYWYLTGLPELLELAGRRFEQFTLPQPGDSP
jgi:integrase